MKQKILFITAFVPHRAAAGEKNTMIMLNDLATDYDVDVVYYKYDFNESYKPQRDNVKVVIEEANSLTRKIWGLLNYPFIHPFFSIRFSWAMMRKINRLCKENNYKAVVMNHSYTFLFGKLGMKGLPKMLICRDVIIQRISRSSNAFMTWLCRKSERFVLNQKSAFVFSVSPKDCKLIEDTYGIKTYLCRAYIDDMIIAHRPKLIDNCYTFFGDWTRKENIEGAMWFFDNVGPLIDFDTTIKIIGRGFPQDYKINNSHIKIEVLGFVDDPYQIISDSTALLTPLFAGAGTKVKVIEALACGTPAIGNEIAFEGLPTDFTDSMILCHTPEEYLTAMKGIQFTIDERILLKNRFVASYQSESIRNYINRFV